MNTLTIERTFQTTAEQLWALHSQKEHLIHWYSPVGFQTEVLELNFEPGGEMFYRQYNDQGEMYGKVFYHTLDKPHLMEFSNGFADESGQLVRHPMAPSWPLKIHNSLTFTEDGDETVLKIVCTPVDASEEELATFKGAFDAVRGGFGGMLDQLESYLREVG